MSRRKLGRKPLPPSRRRVLISARVAPETAKYLKWQDLKLGLLIDQWVRERTIADQAAFEGIKSKPACETLVMDEEDGSDTILESVRGLLALISERGTGHLSQDEIAMLDDNFTLLTNNYLSTLKRKNKQIQ